MSNILMFLRTDNEKPALAFGRPWRDALPGSSCPRQPWFEMGELPETSFAIYLS